MTTDEAAVSPSEYSEQVLKHFFTPLNIGEIENADGEATVGDPRCGDFIKVWIKVKNDIITDFKYKVFGCGAAIATSSVVSELAIGKTFEQAMQLTDDDVVTLLGGLPENKKHCSLLGIRGLQTAMASYVIKENHRKYRKRLQEYLAMGYDVEDSRERIVQRMHALPQQARILEIGTGKGHLAIAIGKSGRSCTTIDLSAQEQHYARLNAVYFGVDERIRMQIQDATRLGFRNETFDAVVSAAALHHIEATEAVLEEIIRVSKENATLILADYNDKGFAIIDRMHRNEGRRHGVLGWDRFRIQDWFNNQNMAVRSSEDDCLWILEVNR
ncbi:iron-sulfur cluster assembly scaffold protein [candidate division KSB1 bacterium]|nr:iron-sulfur cluster assembly scaffold protein [candidate division KSB1 bacterium]